MEIFVANVPYNATEEQLQDLFAEQGVVEKVKLVNDRETGQPRGFGFVTMPNATEARKAIAHFQGFEFLGRPLTVREAEDRRSQGGGGYGGGGRDRGRDGGGYGGGRQRRY